MDLELLDQKIKDSGLKKSFITQELGVSYQSLQRKLKGESDWWRQEIIIVSKLLNLTTNEQKHIFF